TRWLETGPVRAALLTRRKFLQSVIEQKVYFYADIPRIDFETHVDWKQHQCLLKAEFDVDVNTNEATYDIQFGNIKRPTHFNTSWDYARFEVCGHKYADISEGAFGAALLNDCKYGYGIRDGKMTLSLIKSGILPNPEADREEHFFTYSFMPHGEGFADSAVPEQAYMLNLPLRAVSGERETDGDESACFISTDADNVVLETVKKSYDGKRTVIRLHEYKNKRSTVTCAFALPVASVYETDLMENELSPMNCEGNKISFEIKPFEIKTVSFKTL
ncbi:MAG: glycosyl hydrolase-related protein, partial [Clostridiales bacterium]|nr:glycosyl hydrolase-related protein [Clostridiales bacterium]